MGLVQTLRGIVGHPLNRGRRLAALARYLRSQLGSRLVGARVACHNVGVGGRPGVLRFTATEDVTNHVLAAGEEAPGAVERPVRTLDELLGAEAPTLLKIDTEGFETEVIAGAAATLARPE